MGTALCEIFPRVDVAMHYKPSLDHRIVGVAHLVSFLGVYVAVCIAEQLRQSLIDDRQVHGYKAKISRSKKHIIYLAIVGLALGGVAVWGMHYFSLLSLVLTDPISGEKVLFQSSVPVQVLSFFMICITSTIGLTIASHDDMFSRSRASIIDEFMRGTEDTDSFKIHKVSTRSILFTIITKRLDRIILGGLVGAAGIVCMFFFSMQGIVFPGHVELNVGMSILGAGLCALSTICEYWILFRLLSIFPEKEWLRFAVATSGMFSCTIPNYLALGFAQFHMGSPTHLDGLPTNLWGRMRSFNVAFEVLNGALWFMIMYLIWTSRVANMKQARFLRQAEAILYKVAGEQNITSVTQSTKGTGSLGNSHTVTVKSLVEQYLNQRFALEMQLLEAHQRELAMESFGQDKLDRLLERERQANMSFSEFLLHLLWLTATLRWSNLGRALRYELLSYEGSKDSNSNGREFDSLPGDMDEAVDDGDAGHVREPVLSLAELSELTRHGAEEHKRVISRRLVPAYNNLSTVNSSRETVSSFRRSISRRSGLNSRAPTPKVVPIAESEYIEPENNLLDSPILENPDLQSILQSHGKEAINIDV